MNFLIFIIPGFFSSEGNTNPFLNKNERTLKLVRFFIFFIIPFYIFKCNDSTVDRKDKIAILGLIISVCSILTAILIPYLFSKLFSEKEIRIERKREIDKLSLKITLLRKMAYHLLNRISLWEFYSVNIKREVEKNYPTLTYEQYRGQSYPESRVFSSKELDKISQQIYGTDGQAYLAVKGLVDKENGFEHLSDFRPKNYSIQDVRRYKDFTSSIWYTFNDSTEAKIKFLSINSYFLEQINDCYHGIMGKRVEKNQYLRSLTEVLGYFEENVFDKHIFLSTLNSNHFPRPFISTMLNLLIFVIIILFSIFLLVLKIDNHYTFQNVLFFIMSIFISNTIDLVLIIYNAIKSELNIKEIFYF